MINDAAQRGREAVIVAGIRTPFVKSFGVFQQLSSLELGVANVRALLDRSGIGDDAVDVMIWGGVMLPTSSPNLAREIAIDAGLPPRVAGYTVTQACASGLRAICDAAAMIERGHAEVVIAGGSDSISNAPIASANELGHALAPLTRGKASWQKLLASAQALKSPRNLLPQMPKLEERSTGLTMGQAAESMAQKNAIGRLAQDEFALRSHRRAAAATEAGFLSAHIHPVPTPSGVVRHDDLIRPNGSLDKMARLPAAFRAGGSVTAANSSPLTDGSSALLLMRRDRAEKMGLRPLSRIVSEAIVGVDPADQALIGPAIAMPMALKRAGLRRKDVDLYEIHEAFSAQVLSVTQMLKDTNFCTKHLGRRKAFGEIPTDKLNIWGGSIALGHPFAATGARLAWTATDALARQSKKHALIGVCAAGGLGAAALIERCDE